MENLIIDNRLRAPASSVLGPAGDVVVQCVKARRKPTRKSRIDQGQAGERYRNAVWALSDSRRQSPLR
jgi:hypothetical protein